MSNNDLWLRKIAAFLHDPPDKAFWHRFREVDALRFCFWITKSTNTPFYLLKDFPIKKVRAWLRKCLADKWNEIAEAILKDSSGANELKKVTCYKSDGITNSFSPEIFTNYFRRKFHNVASSQIRIHLFGFESSGGGVNQVNLLHPLDESSWVDVIKIAKEFREEFDRESLRDELAREIRSLANIADEFKRFLTLWRKRHWISTISPADTRIPDHPVIDLEIMESAIAATLQKETDQNGNETHNPHPSFLILEFRPVQKFIANARKTRDLWFSSWLISYLAWKAMKPIAEALGPDNIVYPDLYKQPLVDDWLKGLEIKDIPEPNLRMPTLPNTFLAIVPTGEEKDFAKKSQQALKDAWDEIVNGVYDLLTEAGIIERGSPLEKEFKRQTEQLPFDIYWLGLKWGNDPEKAIEDYRKLLSPDRCWEFGRLWNQIKGKGIKTNIGDTYALLVEMAQTGLKALKYRGKPSFTEEKWQKCSLCGEHSALIDLDLDKLESAPDYVNEMIEKFRYKFKDDLDEKGRRNALYYKRLKDFWKKMADAFPGHIKENEHLCAVCLVKRLAPKIIYESVKENAKKNQKSPFFESIVKEFDYHYPSTGSIAIAPFIKKAFDEKVDFSPISKTIKDLLEKASNDNDRKKIKDFLDAHFTEGRTVPAIKERIIPKDIAGERFEGDFEPEWFYDESFSRFYDELEHQRRIGVLKEVEYKEKWNWAKKVENVVERIREIAKKELKDKYHMPRYYAAVYLDGDDLGKWLRGDFAPKIEDVFHPDFVKHVMDDEHFKKIKDLKRPVTPAIHRAISSALRDFALEVVPYVVEHYLGVVIYSGGDDTLFLMPLENLLKTLKALRKLYSGEKYNGEFNVRRFESDKGFIKIYENGELKEIIRVMGTKATLSAGVAIAHYLDPLDITLSKAKKALKDAKNAGRNRAGFNVVLHSGKERKAVVPWNFVETMERFRTEVAGGFSPRFLRTLYQYIDVYQDIPDAFDAEFLKFGARGQVEGAETLLCDLIDARRNNALEPKKFVEALLIADFVVREEGSK